MELQIDSWKCTGCRLCEYACSYHHDEELSAMGSSVMVHRNERKNYYGLIVKRDRDLLLGRPEGAEVLAPGGRVEGGGASSKPILMRSPCDLCEDEDEPFCVRACPMGVFRVA